VSKERRDLALENLALREQLAVLKRPQRRIKIKQRDRLFWIWLSRTWSGWSAALIIVKPATLVGFLSMINQLAGSVIGLINVSYNCVDRHLAKHKSEGYDHLRT
jgi:hypothetical protein